MLGPGIIAASADNDAGGIATYTISGARFGYSLLFSLLIITFILAITQEWGARIGVVTGKGLGGIIREKFGLKWTMFAMFIIFVANLGVVVANVAGIAESMTLLGISKYISIPFSILILWFILYKGSFNKAEKIFLGLSVVYFVYIITAFYAKPDWLEVGKALVIPHFELGKSFLITLIALIGTTVTPWGQCFIQSYIIDKGTPLEKYNYAKIEVFLGAFITDLISLFIIVTAANTLFVNHIDVNTASDAALSLVPIAGEKAKILFSIGLLNAALMGSSIVTLSTSYTLCSALGFEAGLDNNWKEAPIFYGFILGILLLSGLFVLIPGMPLFSIMFLSQTLSGLILPVLLIFVFLILNDARIMGKHRNKTVANFLAIFTLILLFAASFLVIFSSFL